MSRVDELFSKYGSAGRVEVNNSSYDSPLFRKRERNKSCKIKQNPIERLRCQLKMKRNVIKA